MQEMKIIKLNPDDSITPHEIVLLNACNSFNDSTGIYYRMADLTLNCILNNILI